jgi:hypothetical protein
MRGCALVAARVAVRVRAACPSASSCPSWSRCWRRAAARHTSNDSCKPLEQQQLAEHEQVHCAGASPLCWRLQPQQPLSRPPHLIDGARCQRLADLSLRATSESMPTLARKRRDGRKLPMQRHAASPPPAAAAGSTRRCSPLAVLPPSPSLVLPLLRCPFPVRLPLLATCGRCRHPSMRLRRVAVHGGGWRGAAGGGCSG